MKNDMNITERYDIHESKTGELLLANVELDSNEIEQLSSDTPEGHFLSSQVDELKQLGEQSVYAILK